MPSKLKRASNSPIPFSWNDAANLSPSPDIPSLSSPPTVWLPQRDFMKIFGAEPLNATSEIGVVRCKECEKPVLRSCMLEHASNCTLIRNGGRKTKSGVDADGSKKRKVSPDPADTSLPAKKKVKSTPKVTKGRMKGPVDYDRQCGVINDKGLPCSRSLTCKSHAMGAKRSVPGRSKSYDELLLDWQRANNPNFVEPIKRETKAEKKEKRDKEKKEKKRLAEEAAALDPTKKIQSASKKASKKAQAAAAAAAAEAMVDDADQNMNDIDSEAEVDDMVLSIRTARIKGTIGQPLAVPCDTSSWFVLRRERARVCRDLLTSALGIGGGLGMTSRNTSLVSSRFA